MLVSAESGCIKYDHVTNLWHCAELIEGAVIYNLHLCYIRCGILCNWMSHLSICGFIQSFSGDHQLKLRTTFHHFILDCHEWCSFDYLSAINILSLRFFFLSHHFLCIVKPTSWLILYWAFVLSPHEKDISMDLMASKVIR